MSIKRFKSLLFKPVKIQQESERERTRLWPDLIRLLKLKEIRLTIKDNMARIMHNEQNQLLQPIRVKSYYKPKGD